VLAERWTDFDMVGPTPQLTFSDTIVYVE